MFIQKKSGGTVEAGFAIAPGPTLPHSAVFTRVAALVFALALGADTTLAASAASPHQAQAGIYDTHLHDALIAARREGRLSPIEALRQLEGWLASSLSDEARRRVASDSIAIASDAGLDAKAVSLGRRLPTRQLEVYALEALAVSARRSHDLELQSIAISAWRVQQPLAWKPRLHEAYWRLDSADAVAARALYETLTREANRSTDDGEERLALLELRAALARSERVPLQALAAYSEAAALRPARRDLRREADFLLAEIGAASTAADEAEAAERECPGTFSALAIAGLRQEALGQQLRWSIEARDLRRGAERVTELDRVLAGQETALAQIEVLSAQAVSTDAPGLSSLRTRLLSDRLVALVERGRPADAIALYSALQASGAELPYYGLGAAARAFAQQRRSIDAVPLYEAAIAQAGADLAMPDALHFGLVYAYLDTGRFEDAEALLTRMEAGTPVLLRLTPEAGRPNAQYSDVQGLRGLLQIYTGQSALAEETFAQLTQEASLNPGYAYGAGLTARLREHPEAAVARFEAQAANQPDDISARAGHIEALLDAGEFTSARQHAQSLLADAPDSVEALNTERKRLAEAGPRLEIEAEAGSGGAAIANREWRIDSRLSSGLIGDAWRVFYDQAIGQGRTAIGNANWTRAGLGVNWQRGRWLAEGALQHSNAAPNRNSLSARLDYRAGDAWRFSASYDGDSRELPWKARAVRIGARDLGASVGYVVDESRRFDLKWQRLSFSDGNVRNGIEGSWRERWISTPRFQLETALRAEAGRGRAMDTPYFNPMRDASVHFSVRAQWLHWKRDELQFFQAVELVSGRYDQAGFGSRPLWTLRYEHRWDLGPKLKLRYGLSLSSHPYDGVSERQRGVFVNFSTPF